MIGSELLDNCQPPQWTEKAAPKFNVALYLSHLPTRRGILSELVPLFLSTQRNFLEKRAGTSGEGGRGARTGVTDMAMQC